MDPLHETVKVDTQLALNRQMLIKKIHQPGFTPPDTAPDVQSPGVLWPAPADPVKHRWPALTLEGMPQVIQGVYDLNLSRVRLKITLAGEFLVLLKRRRFR